MALRQLLLRPARRAEQPAEGRGIDQPQLRRAVLPGHVDPFGEMAEEAQVEGEGAVRPRRDQRSDLGGERGLAVGGEAHHLVLVAEAQEAQILGDRRVEEAERVGEMDAVEHLDRVAAPQGHHGGDEVAEAVHRQAHRLVERRAVEGGRHVGEVVLDRMERRGRPAERSGDPLFQRGHLPEVAGAAQGAAQAAGMGERQQRLARQVGPGLPGHGEVGHRREIAAGHLLQAEADRQLGETRPVLDAAEALLLDAGHEAAVHHRRGRGVRVIDGETQDPAHRPSSFRSSSSRMSTISRNQKAWRKWKTNPVLPSRMPSRKKYR